MIRLVDYIFLRNLSLYNFDYELVFNRNGYIYNSTNLLETEFVK